MKAAEKKRVARKKGVVYIQLARHTTGHEIVSRRLAAGLFNQIKEFALLIYEIGG